LVKRLVIDLGSDLGFDPDLDLVLVVGFAVPLVLVALVDSKRYQG
jgi:hypothetical protein